MMNMTHTAPSPDGRARPVRVVVIDRDLVTRHGLVGLLRASSRFAVVGESQDFGQALELVRHSAPDVALLGLSGGESLDTLPGLSVLCEVVLLAHRERPQEIQQAVRGGAAGCLMHREFSVTDLYTAVASAARGRASRTGAASGAFSGKLRMTAPRCDGIGPGARTGSLSRRESEIMGHISRGRSNREIADALFLSEKTVKNHVNRIYGKLRVRTRAAAVALWLGADVEASDRPAARRS
ncbi:response regulator transcription factor [Streptomyces sp. BBFR2]|uniref:response regulator transcription factor n=1 Tax=Streptomyces sp. BBFR2 TaxID=3372854 RepID=UPI0037DA4320